MKKKTRYTLSLRIQIQAFYGIFDDVSLLGQSNQMPKVKVSKRIRMHASFANENTLKTDEHNMQTHLQR